MLGEKYNRKDETNKKYIYMKIWNQQKNTESKLKKRKRYKKKRGIVLRVIRTKMRYRRKYKKYLRVIKWRPEKVIKEKKPVRAIQRKGNW